MQRVSDGADKSRRYDSTGISHTGFRRRVNEDAWLDLREETLWAVADGMGGHSRGDVASRLIVEELARLRSTDDPRDDLDALLDALSLANARCRALAAGEVMGSTVVALKISGDQALFAWAGDSRLYRQRNGRLTQLTEDHSLVEEMRRRGQLATDPTPAPNIITRAIGVSNIPELQTASAPLQVNDRFLLASDGLFRDVGDDEIQAMLSRMSSQAALDGLLDLALTRGGRDNATGIVVHVGGLVSALG